MILFKHSEGLAQFFVHYLFFWTSKTFYGQVPYGNLFVPGQISNFDYFSSIRTNLCLGAQNNHLNELPLLSSHNIRFGKKLRKLIFNYTLLVWRPHT